jgi:hypothetical protein
VADLRKYFKKHAKSDRIDALSMTIRNGHGDN